ncbi:MAG: hypothetical protein QM683_19475 [Lacrimispora sp.]
MKRCLTLLLAAATALSLAACGSAKDPKAIYDDASKKTSELTSMDVDSVVNMQMTQGEKITDIKMNLNMKMAGINTENLKYQAQGTTDIEGQSIDISMYYENGYYYMSSMGQKIKYAMDLDAMMKQIKQTAEGTSMDSSYMKDITAKKENGNQVLSFTVDAEKMDVTYRILWARWTDMKDLTYTIKEANGETTVGEDGYFTNSKINMSLEINCGRDHIHGREYGLHLQQSGSDGGGYCSRFRGVYGNRCKRHTEPAVKRNGTKI